MNLFNLRRNKIQGFVYSSDEDNKLFKDSKVGDVITKQDRNPPFIVVDHSLDKIIVTRWPGKLYEVEVINQSKEEGLNKGLVKNVWYTRTLGVKILREVPVENIFGPNGNQISQIITWARNITEEQINSFSKYDLESSRDLFTKAWRNWILITDKEYPYLNEDHFDTLKLFSNNQKYNSPIREGLSIIASQFDIRARELVGESAFGIDDEGEIFLQPKWAKASEILRHGGMSYESDNLLTTSEKQTLRKPVMEVFNLG